MNEMIQELNAILRSQKNENINVNLPENAWMDIADMELPQDWGEKGFKYDGEPEEYATVRDFIGFGHFDVAMKCLRRIAKNITVCERTEGQLDGDGIAIAWRRPDGTLGTLMYKD